MGRPVEKDREQVRDVVVAVRIRAQQRKRWEEQARKQCLTLNEWMRAILDRAARTG